uniref:cDNA clone:J013129D08, full insert sequence n=1 Tax=Oryza sativa subsp. japonica TaxID=39947 RepID=B7EKE5_ORYSJ|nr:unnamed protein product [Oryza sativa Japonica Group]
MVAMPRRPVLWPPAGGRRTLLRASPDRRRVALVRAGPHALRLCSARWPARGRRRWGKRKRTREREIMTCGTHIYLAHSNSLPMMIIPVHDAWVRMIRNLIKTNIKFTLHDKLDPLVIKTAGLALVNLGWSHVSANVSYG